MSKPPLGDVLPEGHWYWAVGQQRGKMSRQRLRVSVVAAASLRFEFDAAKEEELRKSVARELARLAAHQQTMLNMEGGQITPIDGTAPRKAGKAEMAAYFHQVSGLRKHGWTGEPSINQFRIRKYRQSAADFKRLFPLYQKWGVFKGFTADQIRMLTRLPSMSGNRKGTAGGLEPDMKLGVANGELRERLCRLLCAEAEAEYPKLAGRRTAAIRVAAIPQCKAALDEAKDAVVELATQAAAKAAAKAASAAAAGTATAAPAVSQAAVAAAVAVAAPAMSLPPPAVSQAPAAAAAGVVAAAADATTPPVVPGPAASAAAAAASESSEQGQEHWEAAQGEYDAEDDGWDQVEVDDALRLA